MRGRETFCVPRLEAIPACRLNSRKLGELFGERLPVASKKRVSDHQDVCAYIEKKDQKNGPLIE